jgi:hypothetical protein
MFYIQSMQVFGQDLIGKSDKEIREIFYSTKLCLPFVLRQPPLCNDLSWPRWGDINGEVRHFVYHR